MNPSRASSTAIVIGGGVIGLFTAWRLLDAGFAVTVIERDRIGGSASWAAGGILSPLPPWETPDEVWALAAESIKAYPAIAAELLEATGIDPQWWRCGMRVRGVDGSAVAEEWSRTQGYSVVDSQWPAEAGAQPSLYLPWVAQVRSTRLLKALHLYLLKRGCALRQHLELRDPETRTGELAGFQDGHGDCHSADVYVICAGAWSGRFEEGLGVRASSIHPVLGQMLLLQGRPGQLSEIMLAEDRYLIPRRDGKILVGSTLEHSGFEQKTTPAARAALLADAHRILPQTRAMPVVDHWCGLRPASPQGLPLIKRVERFKSVYLNAGHYRNGITLAPASADRLRELINDQSKSC